MIVKNIIAKLIHSIHYAHCLKQYNMWNAFREKSLSHTQTFILSALQNNLKPLQV